MAWLVSEMVTRMLTGGSKRAGCENQLSGTYASLQWRVQRAHGRCMMPVQWIMRWLHELHEATGMLLGDNTVLEEK